MPTFKVFAISAHFSSIRDCRIAARFQLKCLKMALNTPKMFLYVPDVLAKNGYKPLLDKRWAPQPKLIRGMFQASARKATAAQTSSHAPPASLEIISNLE